MRLLSAFLLILVCCGAMRAEARNVNLMSCACSATADFVLAAKQQAHLFDQNGGGAPGGNYIVASTTGAKSAYLSVTGSFIIKNQEVGPVWVTSAVTPIDSNSVSLAAQPEAVLQTFYTSFDAVIMGTGRKLPTSVAVPYVYTSTFINSSEEEVSPGIGAGLLDAHINQSVFPVGSFILVTFTDGSTALYEKVSLTGSYMWKWTGVAHDSKGNKINRNGTPATSLNSGGGGGSSDVVGFSSGNAGGGGFSWDFVGDGVRGVITIEYGGAGGAHYISYF